MLADNILIYYVYYSAKCVALTSILASREYCETTLYMPSVSQKKKKLHDNFFSAIRGKMESFPT